MIYNLRTTGSTTGKRGRDVRSYLYFPRDTSAQLFTGEYAIFIAGKFHPSSVASSYDTWDTRISYRRITFYAVIHHFYSPLSDRVLIILWKSVTEIKLTNTPCDLAEKRMITFEQLRLINFNNRRVNYLFDAKEQFYRNGDAVLRYNFTKTGSFELIMEAIVWNCSLTGKITHRLANAMHNVR